jgi:hypothetical protein
MVQGVTALTGLAQIQTNYNPDSQATPEQRMGDTVDPRHGDAGPPSGVPPAYISRMTPGGSHGPYGPQNQLLGDPDWVWQPAGDESEDPTMDVTPSKRAGPWPKGVRSGPIGGETPDTYANQLEKSRIAHGIRTNAGAKALYPPQAYIQNDDWSAIWEVDPGHSDQERLPRQAMSSGFIFGTTDRVQSMARQNQYGFDSAHKQRRFAEPNIPGNNYWMVPGGRPLRKTLAGPARPPVGGNSPFAGDDLGQAFGINGAYLQTVPPEYDAPPQPNLAKAGASPAPVGVEPGGVEWY